MKYLLLAAMLFNTAFGQYVINAKSQVPIKGMKKPVIELDTKQFHKDFKHEKKVNLWVGGYSLRLERQADEGTLIVTNNGVYKGRRAEIYTGTIADGGSVCLSVSNGKIEGLIKKKTGSITLAENDTTAYLYDEDDAEKKQSFSCEVKKHEKLKQSGGGYSYINLFPKNSVVYDTLTRCVGLYWEVDYDLVVAKGGVANTVAYVQGIFAQVQQLYAAIGVKLVLKKLYVWASEDPYVGVTTGDFITQFTNLVTAKDWAGANLAHLIGTKGNGGVAYVNSFYLCQYFTNGYQNFNASTGYSGIHSTYNALPNFSWTIACITHELGHNLGADHTHDCVWNGNYTKIDDCGGAAGYSGGTCLPNPPLPGYNQGTIMSYCNLISGVRTSMVEDYTGDKGGFGVQVADKIRKSISGAACRFDCGVVAPCVIREETQLLPCPTGYTGSISQMRYDTCGRKSAWVTTINTCTATPTPTTPTTPTTTLCPTPLVITCSITQRLNDVICNRSGYTNYKYSWTKNGIKQTWTGPTVAKANYKVGDVLSVTVTSSNAQTSTKCYLPCTTNFTIK